ncbi:MAG: glutaredoxin family protein [Clostridia bacterium]|nr:glutaredoxin family protein [Clostridia bacterium]
MITLFYLEHCPYCRNAKKAIQELTEENEAYRAISIQWIEESRQPDVAEQYDYYHVPTVFCGNNKLYEATPGESYAQCKAQLQKVFDQVLSL